MNLRPYCIHVYTYTGTIPVSIDLCMSSNIVPSNSLFNVQTKTAKHGWKTQHVTWTYAFLCFMESFLSLGMLQYNYSVTVK